MAVSSRRGQRAGAQALPSARPAASSVLGRKCRPRSSPSARGRHHGPLAAQHAGDRGLGHSWRHLGRAIMDGLRRGDLHHSLHRSGQSTVRHPVRAALVHRSENVCTNALEPSSAMLAGAGTPRSRRRSARPRRGHMSARRRCVSPAGDHVQLDLVAFPLSGRSLNCRTCRSPPQLQMPLTVRPWPAVGDQRVPLGGSAEVPGVHGDRTPWSARSRSASSHPSLRRPRARRCGPARQPVGQLVPMPETRRYDDVRVRSAWAGSSRCPFTSAPSGGFHECLARRAELFLSVRCPAAAVAPSSP